MSDSTIVCIAEASDAIDLLMKLCPSFVVPRVIDRETWLEMPAANWDLASVMKSPTKRFPASPGAIRNEDIEEELLSRKPGEGSPKRIRANPRGRDFTSLRDVRERIRAELAKE